jgi:acyl-CoA thioester hydrolase
VSAEPFLFRLRVRYNECDAQGIVFNARWADYIDIAVGEYTRAVFLHVDLPPGGIDWRLVKQTIEWRAPARHDDVLDIRVRTLRIGTTSFALATELHRGSTHLATAETVYVVVDNAANTKLPVPAIARAALERGAPGLVVDQTAVAT